MCPVHAVTVHLAFLMPLANEKLYTVLISFSEHAPTLFSNAPYAPFVPLVPANATCPFVPLVAAHTTCPFVPLCSLL